MYVNQDPKYWYRLVVNRFHGGTNSNRGFHRIYLGEFEENQYSGGLYFDYHPAHYLEHEHLAPDYPCYLAGGITDESLYYLFDGGSILEYNIPELSVIAKWKAYWDKKKEEEARCLNP